MSFMRKLPLLLLLATFAYAADAPKTRNVILITADGLRWQDLFTGIDPLLMNAKEAGMKDAKDRRDRYWRDTPEERRRALMPFFWTKLASRAVIFGNVTRGSSAKVSNAYRVSYPGYAEILTGHAQDDAIKGNDSIQNPTETVLEVAKRVLNLDQSQVALFSSWDHFVWIGESKRGSITINAGAQLITDPRAGMRSRDLSIAQLHAKTPWDEARHDYYTFELATEYMKTLKPRVMFISLDETDDWAHDKRYDRVLDSIAYFDSALRQLFDLIDSMPEYKGNTTVLIACDHGRGSTLSDWTDHGKKVAGAEQIWLAIAGPDTPAIGEAKNVPEISQSDITPTILSLLGIDLSEMPGITGSALRFRAK